MASVLPHPPALRTSADFVVAVFVVTVATMLVVFAAGVAIAAMAGNDVATMAGTLVDIMTTIVGALIGFVAGKGATATDPGSP